MNNNWMKNVRGFVPYVLLIFVVLLLARMVGMPTMDQPKKVNYSELIDMIDAGQLSDVMVSGDVLVARTTASKISQSDFPRRYDIISSVVSLEQFQSSVNALYAKKLGVAAEQISTKDYSFKLMIQAPEKPPWWMEWLPFMIPLLLIGALWFFMMRQQTGSSKGVMSFGRSRARLTDPEKNKVTFADLAGIDEEKEELSEIVDFLKNPQRFLDVGARIPKGVLLVGPPGTGKTHLARAVAGEAGVPFFTISGSDFVEMFVGVGASRVRDLFDQAKKHSPAIVFIDEIDAVGRQRGAGLGGGHDEREQTLNQLLVEMDGFSSNEGVIVMAATNRSDILDPALLRPGRFDRRVTVGYPDIKGREEILKIHARGKPLDEGVELSVLARLTPFFTGADLENVLNEGAILTARAGLSKITMGMLEEAIKRVWGGPEKRSHKVTEKDRQLVAYHEAGHALVAHFMPECDEVQEVVIVPRGQAAGYTTTLPEQELDHASRAKLLAEMTLALGGHAAEKLMLGDVSTGSTSDLKRATSIARRMITEFGMSEDLGPVFLGGDHEVFLGRDFSQARSPYSESVAAAVDKEVMRLLDGCYQRAEELIKANVEKFKKLVSTLLEKERVGREEFSALMADAEMA